MNLTPAQKRAILWLPADGSWRNAGGAAHLWDALWGILELDLAINRRGIDGGGWRLTPAGIAARKAIEGEAQT